MQQLSFDDLEIWLPIAGYEGLYEISALGRIRSLARRTTRGGILKASPGWAGYLKVSLSKPGVIRSYHVHRLVAATFLGPCPEGQQVRHLDGDPLNNTLTNLRYGTVSDNALDRVLHGTHRNTRKDRCPQGHEYTPENTIRRDKGRTRCCRTCRNRRRRAWRQRRRKRGLRVT